MLVKKNTFTDFIAAANTLSRRKYTAPSRLAIMGGSAGGLLMGAVTNMRPELFDVVVANVPFVDALKHRARRDSPADCRRMGGVGNPSQKRVLRLHQSYAPYENVEAKEYPKILVTAGLNDPRVSYWSLRSGWRSCARSKRIIACCC